MTDKCQLDIMATPKREYLASAKIHLTVDVTRFIDACSLKEAQYILQEDIAAGRLRIVYDRAPGAEPEYQLMEVSQEVEIEEVSECVEDWD